MRLLKRFALAPLIALALSATLRAQSYEFTTFVGSAGVGGTIDGAGTAARFNQPLAPVIGKDGNLYIGEGGSGTIRKITPAGAVTTIAGKAGVGGTTDGPALDARFYVPWGLGFDVTGSLYIADFFQNTIRKLSSDGNVSTISGRAGQMGGADGQGTAATFNGPTFLAIDSAGNIFVADYTNSIIRKITSSGLVSTFAGTAGITGSTNGTGAAARFTFPAGLVIDGADNLFVADSGAHIIRKITPAGVVSTFAGAAGTSGSADGPGGTARFFTPNGIAIDAAGNLYVTEHTNQTIRKITPAGVVSTIAGLTGTAGSADGIGSAARFNKPYGIVVDRDGTLYVADTFNHTIRRGVVVPPPVIAASPQSLTVTPGSTVALAVSATGGTLTYQWKKNNLPIPGQTAATYVFSGQTLTAGTYTVDVTNGAGTVTSATATITVADSTNPGRITNLAIRSQAGTDAQTLIVGTVLGGAGTSGAKPLLVRAVGPTLAGFGVTGALADPTMTVFNGLAKFAENDDWAGGFDFASVGAFPFTGAAPKDAAIYNAATPSGSYSIQVSGKNAATGTALAEIYDATPVANYTAATPRLINVSARTQVGIGADILIAGFNIGGATAKTVLIRAAGPALVAFGVGGALANPKLDLFSGLTLLYSNDDWAGDSVVSSAGASVGAFPFTNATSKDAALLVTLAPGGYTVQVSGVGNTSGVALIEVYEVP